MHFMWFTERAYHYDPEENLAKYDAIENDVIRKKSFFGTPNRFFERKHGAELLNQYLDEKIYTDSELLNFDGVMLNEHHGTPFCLGAVMDVEASILAKTTKRVKIVLLGNPVTTVGNPVRMAEELAMIDLISKGRLVPGFVRGAGSEQLANNANPAYNREMFEEGVDLILKCWTQPGPFRHEGKHFHFRHVNPWVLPYQEPHPPLWIPGLISPDTADWCARRRYPYIALATRLEPTLELWDFYTKAAARAGYQAGPENFGYLQPVMVSDSQERAEMLGKRILYGGSFAHFARPEWMFPSGYNSKAATRRLAEANFGTTQVAKPIHGDGGDEDSPAAIEAAKQAIYAGYPDLLKDKVMIAGTPDNVIEKLKQVIGVLRPGIFTFWIDGPIPAKDRMRCVELLNRDVIPALREYGNQLGLADPFVKTPGSTLLKGREAEPVGNREALAAMV